MEIKHCKICGKEIKVYKKTPNKKYCSRNCYNKAIKAKVVKRVCDNCGKIYYVSKWKSFLGQKKYFCEYKCYSQYIKSHPSYRKTRDSRKLKEHPVLTKEVLNKEYLKNKLTIKKIAEKYNYGYVTVQNWVKRYGIKTRICADYKHDVTSFIAISRRLINKRGNKCELCGWNKARCDIHHRIARKDRGSDDESNLIILCPNCHRVVTQNKLKI